MRAFRHGLLRRSFSVPALLLLLLGGTCALPGQTVELLQMPLAELEQKADSGDSSAIVQLAVRHNIGQGVPQSFALAQKKMEEAAALGNPTAIGTCAMLGWGGAKQDPHLAFSSLQKAAVKGDLTAVRNLGRCYETGIGCEKDPAMAQELYKKASAAGDPAALYFLAEFLRKGGTGSTPNFSVARDFYKQASDLGHRDATLALARNYQTGQGVTKSAAKSQELNDKATVQKAGAGMSVFTDNGPG